MSEYHAAMMSCCRAGACEEIFGPQVARKNLKRYRKKGLGAIERQMVASISTDDVAGARVLEIGGGIGAIQVELLASGARDGEIVELVQGYEPYAVELAQEKGLAARSRFRVADVLAQPEAVPPADVVVLNRVVCCSPDGVQLTETAARLATRVLILSFPRDRFLARAFARIINALQRLTRRSFRVFLHPKPSLFAAAQAQGLRLAGTGRTLVWEFAALRRAEDFREIARR
jgi:hypothetical protein